MTLSFAPLFRSVRLPANPDTVPPTLYVTIVLQVTFTFVTSAELTVPDPLVTVQV